MVNGKWKEAVLLFTIYYSPLTIHHLPSSLLSGTEFLMANRYVGQRVKRTEDPRLIKGLAHYVDDIGLLGTLHVAFVRSIYAHARVTNVDVSEAVNAPGVVAVYTGSEVSEKIGPVPCAS